MSGIRFALGLVFAVALHAAGTRLDPRFAAVVDPFLVVVVIQALRHSPVGSAVGGSIVGLVQDALSGGPFGLHGFVDTLVAWLATLACQRFVIQRPAQIGMLCLLAAGFQQLALMFLRLAMVADAEAPDPVEGMTKMATSAVLAALFVAMTERSKTWARRRRDARGRRLRLGT